MKQPVSSEERDLFFTLALDMLCVASLDGYFKRINPAFEETLGYTEHELLSRPFIDFVHPEDRAATLSELSRLDSGEKTISFENRYARKDGSHVWLAWKAVPVLAEGLVYATARDVTARLEAEEALQESEERFRTLADNISQLAWMADGDGWIFWYNKRWFDYTGTTLEEMQGWGWRKVHHPEHLGRVVERLQRSWDTGEPWEDTFPLRGRDGAYRWFLSRARPIHDESGRIVRWFGTNTDVTEHMRAEERTRFLANLNQTLQPITDPDEVMAVAARMLGEYVGADRCAYADVEEDEDHFTITGDHAKGVESIVGRFAMSQFGAEALRLMRANEPYVVTDSETDERVREEDLPAYRMTGIRAVICVPLHKAGRFVAGMAVHQKTPRNWTSEEVDLVTTVVERCWESIERARVMRSLRESEERYRTLVAASTSIVWTADPEGRFVEPQLSWEAYTGQSWEEHRNFGWTQALHPEDRESVRGVWERARDSRERYASGGRLWHEPSKTYRHFIARALPLLDAEGSAREWVGMIGDVEDLKEAEAEIRRLNARLEERVRERTTELAEAVEELESFSYSVSHDLRAPIRHIGGFARMLHEKSGAKLDETSRRYLDTIIRANERAGTLVDDLLAFSRMGRADMQHAAVDMNHLVKETLDELEPDLNGRKIDWRIIDDLPEVRGDRSMLRLTVRNLLANAVKYTRPRDEAEIEVGYVEGGEEIVFFVKDNGVGFDMKYVDKLFGVFQRLHGPEEFEGTGIGLASVKRVVRRHGGRVWAEGSPDGGAAFHFSLPKTKLRSERKKDVEIR